MTLSRYMKSKIKLHLVASKIWIVTNESLAAKCDLCPVGIERVSRTSISFSYRIGPQDSYRICYRCMGKIHLRREREHWYAELRVYMPIKAQRLRLES